VSEELPSRRKTEQGFEVVLSRPFHHHTPSASYSEVKHPLSSTASKAHQGSRRQTTQLGYGELTTTVKGAAICYIPRCKARLGSRSRGGAGRAAAAPGEGPGALRGGGKCPGAAGGCLDPSPRALRGAEGRAVRARGRKRSFSGKHCSGTCCVK